MATYRTQRSLIGNVGQVINRVTRMFFGVSTPNQILSVMGNKIDFAKEVDDVSSSDVAMACIHWAMRTFPEAPFSMQKVMVDEGSGDTLEQAVIEHPLLALMEDPNPFYPLETLWSSTVMSYLLDGNAYWMKVYGRGTGKPVQLWWVPHTLMEPVLPWELDQDEGIFINYYRYSVPGKGEYYIPPDNIVHFRFGQDPQNQRSGLSPLKAALREIYTDQEASEWSAALLKNGAVPGIMVAPDNSGYGARASRDDLLSIKAYMEQTFSGGGRGKPHVSTAPVKIEQFGYSPEQMSLRDIRRVPEERISALLGIPAVVAGLGAGLDRSTFTNMGEAREMAYESNIIPTHRIFAVTLEKQLLNTDFNTADGRRKKQARLKLYFDTSKVRVLQEDENKKIERYNKMVLGGWARIAEARRAHDLPVNQYDEVYLRNPSTMMEVEADKPRPEPEPIQESGMSPPSGNNSSSQSKDADEQKQDLLELEFIGRVREHISDVIEPIEGELKGLRNEFRKSEIEKAGARRQTGWLKGGTNGDGPEARKSGETEEAQLGNESPRRSFEGKNDADGKNQRGRRDEDLSALDANQEELKHGDRGLHDEPGVRGSESTATVRGDDNERVGSATDVQGTERGDIDGGQQDIDDRVGVDGQDDTAGRTGEGKMANGRSGSVATDDDSGSAMAEGRMASPGPEPVASTTTDATDNDSSTTASELAGVDRSSEAHVGGRGHKRDGERGDVDINGDHNEHVPDRSGLGGTEDGSGGGSDSDSVGDKDSTYREVGTVHGVQGQTDDAADGTTLDGSESDLEVEDEQHTGGEPGRSDQESSAEESGLDTARVLEESAYNRENSARGEVHSDGGTGQGDASEDALSEEQRSEEVDVQSDDSSARKSHDMEVGDDEEVREGHGADERGLPSGDGGSEQESTEGQGSDRVRELSESSSERVDDGTEPSEAGHDERDEGTDTGTTLESTSVDSGERSDVGDTEESSANGPAGDGGDSEDVGHGPEASVRKLRVGD